MTEELIGSKFNIKTKFLWHSTQIYCLAFDRKGKYIFTGGDDGILRVYSIAKDRLIRCLSDQKDDEFAEGVEEVCRTVDFETTTEVNIEVLLEKFAICDIAVNQENTLLSAGKHNGLRDTFDLIVKLEEQMFPIRSVLFSPAIFDENKKYLISTSEDGFIFFYVYNHKTLEFQPKALHRRSKYEGERAVNICVDMTTGGLLLGLMHTFGAKREVSKPKSKKSEPFVQSADDIQSAIRIFSLSDELGLKEEWKTTYHKSHSNCVYSLRFSHNTFRFASACDNDSNAFIWSFDKSNKKWDSIIIGINTTADSKKLLRGKSKQRLESAFVEEIVFSCDDKYMITVLTDVSVKVWNSESGEMVRHFNQYHSVKISVVDCHPSYGHIFLSAGYDSNIYIFDIITGNVLQHFDCSLNSQIICGNSVAEESISLKPLILQCSFSPDGQTIAATDNYGNLTIFTLDSRKESDCLDQLEEALFRMHSESDEENGLTEMGITPSEEVSKFINAMFEYETDLLRGIEKPSPLKQSQNIEDKKIDFKAVKKLDFKSDSSAEQIPKVKSSPIIPKKGKNLKKKTPPKKPIESTVEEKEVKDISPKEKTPNSSKVKTNATPKLLKYTKDIIRNILDDIFENPSSRPFQVNDEIQYPTFRKEISDADLSLTSIREEMLLNKRYSLVKFNKDMNKVIENAKSFYKHNDEEVYEMALILEKFYCNKMETQFGSSFKPPLSLDSSDDEMSDISTEKKSIPTKPVPKTIEDELSDKSDTNSVIESKTSALRSKSVPKKSPKLNGKQTPKLKTTKDSNSVQKVSSTRKRSTNKEKSDSDSEPIVGKRTKSSEEVTKTPEIETNDETHKQNVNDIQKEITEDIQKNMEVDTPDEGSKSSDSSIEPFNDLVIAEVEEEKEEEVMETPIIEEPTIKPVSVVNGTQSKPETNSCVNRKQSPQLKNCLFCVFCEKIFWSVSEAKSHYIHHLCPLKCCKCDALFTLYDDYLSHDCDHPKTPNNIEWCRQYSDSINWIEKFLDFQQTEDIESFETISKNNKSCVVCERVEKFRPEANQRKKETKVIDGTTHLERHLKYVPQYQCLVCLLSNDKYFYCRNAGEAEKHLSKDHSSYSTCASSLHYFDGSIPKLDEIILRFHS